MYQNVNCISIWLFLKVFGPIVPKPELHCRCNDGAKKSQSFIKLTFEFTLYSEVYCFQYCCTVVRVSVQGVKSLSGHFACLCRGFDFYEVKKKYYFSKRKGKYFYTFNHFYSEKSSKKGKIAQIYKL